MNKKIYKLYKLLIKHKFHFYSDLINEIKTNRISYIDGNGCIVIHKYKMCGYHVFDTDVDIIITRKMLKKLIIHYSNVKTVMYILLFYIDFCKKKYKEEFLDFYYCVCFRLSHFGVVSIFAYRNENVVYHHSFKLYTLSFNEEKIL